ncbi:MAG TPA: gluconate 2-dehydrogenase subunit 3 family protein [Saprospiraceae bacterium]|nr:gluconate 2-dehydrogenase subunit 3 family protein [Saprospiraceae bacterium]
MKRRDNIKLLLAGGLGTGLVLTSGCNTDGSNTAKVATKSGAPGLYGRTDEEKIHDQMVMSETFFTPQEMTTIAVLADIIIPKDEVSCSATEAGVPDFIEFIVKDIPSYKTPVRGGLKWLDNFCISNFEKSFSECSTEQQMQIVDEIAWPDKAKPEFKYGVKFFNTMRNLVATGFYTSKEGIKDIGYIGNAPNEWDGVPDEVLKKYGFEEDPKYKDVYVDPATRNEIMVWS